MSPEIEEIIHHKRITSNAAWVRLFDETLANLTIQFHGQEMTLVDVGALIGSESPEERKEASQAISCALKDNIKLLTFITNTLANDKCIEDKKRNFKTPIASRNISNLISDKDVSLLIETTKKNYESISHRYYNLKADMMNVDKLHYWDRSAPLFENDEDEYIPWNDAKNMVLTAYGEFSQEMADIAEQFFAKSWIDARPRSGKRGGAFSHSVCSSAHPYVMLNYHGKKRDVMTMAHELGHGVHQVLAAQNGTLLSYTPITIAETASIFAEQLTFDHLISATGDKVRIMSLLTNKIEDAINTIVRQIAFCDFELQLHNARKKGELKTEEINEIWLKITRESLGPRFAIEGDDCKYLWSSIPHFIHAPFYVYSYAFGSCITHSLYNVYTKGNIANFKALYLDLLRSAGTKHYSTLLQKFSLDVSDAGFWQHGFDFISDLIGRLESLRNQDL